MALMLRALLSTTGCWATGRRTIITAVTTSASQSSVVNPEQTNPEQTTIPFFESLSHLCEFGASNLDSMTSAEISSYLGKTQLMFMRAREHGEDIRTVQQSDGFRKLTGWVRQLAVRASDAKDAVHLLRTAQALRPDRFVNPVLKETAEVIMKHMVNHTFPVSSKEMVPLVHGCIALNAADVRLVPFLKEELPSMIPDLSPIDCRMMWAALVRTKMGDLQLQDALLDKIASHMDEFANADVVNILLMFSRAGFCPRFDLLEHCIDLISRHTSLFDAEELINAGISLVRLSRMDKLISYALVDELKRKGRNLGSKNHVRCLSLLTCLRRPEAAFANELVALVRGGKFPRTIHDRVKTCHAIAFFELLEHKDYLLETLEELLREERLYEHNLTMLMDTVEASAHFMGVKVNVPDAFHSQWEMHTSASSEFLPRSAILLRDLMPKLPPSHQFKFETGVRVGPYRPHLVDPVAKVIVDFLRPTDPFTGMRLRMKLYGHYGYTGTRIDRFPVNAPEDKMIAMAINKLDGVAVKLGRATDEEVRTRREEYRRSRDEQRV